MSAPGAVKVPPAGREGRWVQVAVVAARTSGPLVTLASHAAIGVGPWDASGPSIRPPKSPHRAWMTAIAASGAVSVRRMRGPRRTPVKPAARAAARSASLKPPSGPISRVMSPSGAGSPGSGVGLRWSSRMPPGWPWASQSSSRAAGPSPGRRRRPLCSQAAIITPSQWAWRLARRSGSRRTTLRPVNSGVMRSTPNSTAFCRAKSMRSPLETPSPRWMRKAGAGSASPTASQVTAVWVRWASSRCPS